jgi:crotonobetainyl-CoA:carnitine CoA-transferase CaiB-like acyl-CoA transferase
VSRRAQGALEGVLVVDLSRVLAGPYAAMLLGDLGASVVKVEAPGRGDDTRLWGPPFTADGESAYFLAANRNKRGIAVDLRHEGGRAVLDDLLARADVLIENFRASTRAAVHLTGEETTARFPRLVHAAISGFGATGRFAGRPGYDSVAQAGSGLMSITGEPAAGPFKVGVAVSDLAAGLHAAVAILAALRHRDRHGRGQFVDVSLFDASLGLLANVASAALVSGEAPRRWGNAHPSIVPYEAVAAKDGDVMLAVGNDAQFRAFAEVVGEPGWSNDPRFATNPARVVHRDALLAMIRERFAGRTVAQWLAALEAAGVPAGPVRSVPEALDSPEARERGMIDRASGVPMVAPVPRLSATPARVDSAPPRLGEHTEAVLAELLGYDAERIAALRAAGAIAGLDPRGSA